MDPTIKSVGGIGGKYVRRKVAELASDPANVRKHNEKNLDAIKASLTRFGQQKPIVIDKSGVVRAGNGTLAAAKALGWAEIDCVETELEGAEATAYAIADNRTAELAEWDEAALTAVLQSLEHEDAALLDAAGFDKDALAAMLEGEAGELRSGNLAALFGAPPFSVLDARQGYWQDRKRAWLALGIRSELGRGAPIGGGPMPLDRERERESGSLQSARAAKRASPGGSLMPACNYSKRQRGDGRGKAI